MSHSEHLVPRGTPIYVLEVSKAWEKLTPKEKKYAHFLSKASWAGSKACLEQLSPESPTIFALFQHLFHLVSLEELQTKSGVSQQAFSDFVDYVTTFYGNLGNYLSFGDQKFVPRVSSEDLSKIISSIGSPLVNSLYEKCKEKIFSLNSDEKELGFPGAGISTYYSPNITKDDIAFVQEYLNANSISPYNTRIFKLEENGKEPVFQLRFASAEKKTQNVEFKGRTIQLEYGDYAPFMADVVENLENALPFAANQNQHQMILKYIETFKTGDINAHKDSQRWWIKDKGPTVETNIGFIESYRDPFGVRGEWEGLVAVVNKDMSAKFGELVANAKQFISLLPWPSTFEKDTFLEPDFTSLEVLCFASSGIPAGINIPNYDDIRQQEGFKNVSLGNVLSARKLGEHISFIEASEQSLFDNLVDHAFEVQVGIHELLGHGSGKLFHIDAEGKFNFDKEKTINPLTNKPVESWYTPGESWDSKFLSSASTIEECRAECCGLYLCTNAQLLSIFGHSGQSGEDVAYINWLSMVRKGILALEMYSPETNKWRQAHMQARYVILNVLREAGEGFVTILTTDDGPIVKLDRSKIKTVGLKAIGDFLAKLMIYKATADVQSMNTMYDRYSAVSSEYLEMRKAVLAKKQPRRVFVQAHTYTTGGEVSLKTFEATPQGMIDSFVARFGPVH